MPSDDPRLFGELLSANGVPITIWQHCDQVVIDSGGLAAVLGPGQQDAFMEPLMAAWMAAEEWAARRPALEVVSDG